MNTQLLGFLTPWIVYAIITLLHIILPGRKIKGYVKHEQSGEVLHYRLNGHLVLPGSIFLWLLVGRIGLVPYDWLYHVRWYSLTGAIVMGLLFSFGIVLCAPAVHKNFLADLWFGRLKNPQCKDGFVDAKMWLYLIGAVMLQLNVLSFLAYHWLTFESINPGFFLGACMLTWFVWDYLNFERVHLYTYDFIAEYVGFKLGFGCLAFYPYFYSVALWFAADLPNPGHPLWLTVLFGLIFLSGYTLARGANMQKFYFKISPEKSFLGIKPFVLSDGKHSLLANGF